MKKIGKYKMKKDLVSVIMPTYNAGKFLADSIQCILRQTYDNLELIITDDASTDEDTIKILKEFAQADKRVKIELLSENHGPGYARNACIKRAEGRYIAFCDCDDRWIPEKLEIQINYMSEKKCALCCATYLICNSNYETTGINIPPRRITYKMIKRDNKIGCLTAIYDTKALGKKYYMPTIRKRQDWALFIQILQQCKICYAYTKKPLAYYCVEIVGKYELSSQTAQTLMASIAEILSNNNRMISLSKMILSSTVKMNDAERLNALTEIEKEMKEEEQKIYKLSSILSNYDAIKRMLK
jgi:glycosyltransferase involved in cell wall biosynthesis